MARQLPLPLAPRAALTRADLIVTPANHEAVAFIDAWPDWPVPAAAFHGPQGCGKTHLISVWHAMSGASRIAASVLSACEELDGGPVAIENVDASAATMERDRLLFAAIEGATRERPVVLTGRTPPPTWNCALPDLSSRMASLTTFALWRPDDGLLAALARKLFADRQLDVPPAVVDRMLVSLERSPGAFRDFIALADAKALAEARPITIGLVRELLAECDQAAMTDSHDSASLRPDPR
ncbi:MAG TPA: hypothetical protein VGF97_12045 [Rhizomicrobium sp.]|jgi:chromosomal replication initiation ATPase DnaA